MSGSMAHFDNMNRYLGYEAAGKEESQDRAEIPIASRKRAMKKSGRGDYCRNAEPMHTRTFIVSAVSADRDVTTVQTYPWPWLE